jgi:hypothetical protein
MMTRRSLGDGLGLLLFIGSLYGIARCRVFDGFTHFLFDASALGAYVGAYPRLTSARTEAIVRLKRWILALAALPVFLILLSPFIDAQPVLIQLLGLRPILVFLPLLLIGAVVEPAEVKRLAGWAIAVALGTAVVALAEYFYGVEPFFPVNDASRIIYMSGDIGEEHALRIPATFSSAHAYGGTMVGLVPLLVLLLSEKRTWVRTLAMGALCAAALGVFACAARLPFIGLLLVFAAITLRGVRQSGIRAGAITVFVLVALMVRREERLQRFETLSDPESVSRRVEISLNAGLLDAILDQPLGRGLGSAVGTSIPYFLADEAKPQVGLESEFARIGIEQGVLGLALWLAFGTALLARNPKSLTRLGGIADAGIWSFCIFNWGSGLIGAGFLAAVPGTMLLMVYMGVISVTEKRATVAEFPQLRRGGLAHQQRA